MNDVERNWNKSSLYNLCQMFYEVVKINSGSFLTL